MRISYKPVVMSYACSAAARHSSLYTGATPVVSPIKLHGSSSGRAR